MLSSRSGCPRCSPTVPAPHPQTLWPRRLLARGLHLRWLHTANTPLKYSPRTKPTTRRSTQWFKHRKKKKKKKISLWYVTPTAMGQTVLSLRNHPIPRDGAAFRKTRDTVGFVPGPAAAGEGTDSEAPTSLPTPGLGHGGGLAATDEISYLLAM